MSGTALDKSNEVKEANEMSDSSTLTKLGEDDIDSSEENLSSEEWTIIDQKDSDDSEEKKIEGPKETVVSEEACDSKESNKTEHVEEGEEAGEKEPESDDVSILSDDSECEQITLEDGRIERIEWRFDRRASEENELVPNDSDGNVSANALITCSLVALILGIIIAGQIVEFKGEKSSYIMNTELESKLKELSGIEERLRELKDVKQALEQIKISMPEMKLLKDQLANQKKEKYKPKQSIDDFKNLEKLNIENILNLNAYDDKLDILEATYQNFCLTVNRLNSTSLVIDRESCKTPKVLADMIIFKKSLRHAFDESHQRHSPEKRMFVDIERKLDSVSDSLLSDMSIMFSRFSLKIQDRFSKFAYNLKERVCILNNNGKADDEFLNILLNNEYFLKNCDNKFDSNRDDYVKLNSSRKENNTIKKKSLYETQELNDYKYSGNVDKNHNNHKNSRDSHTFDKENENSSNNFSRGEVKVDNWKEHRIESYSENKDTYRNLPENNVYDDNNNRDPRSNANRGNSSENFRKNGYDRKNENSKENSQERKTDSNNDSKEKYHSPPKIFTYKSNGNVYDTQKQDYNVKYDSYKRENNYIREQQKKLKKEWDNEKYGRKQDYDFDRKYEHNIYHPDFDPTFEKYVKTDYYHKQGNKKDRDSEPERKSNKRAYDYDDNDSKFVVKDDNQYAKQKYKYEKEEYFRPETFKEAKYTKYHSGERKDKREKYQVDGDWQMQRGESREKLRNSDWYFVRADSRKKSRRHWNSLEQEEDEEEEEEEVEDFQLPQRPPRRRKNFNENFDDDKSRIKRPRDDGLKHRFLKRLNRGWNILSNKVNDYL